MKHLTENNLTYLGHMKKSFSHIISCQKVSFKLLVHALFPFIWKDTGWKDLGK